MTWTATARAAALAAIAIATGCGGGDDSGGAAGRSGAGGSAGADAGDAASPPVGSMITRVSLASYGEATPAGPVTFAQAFRVGDVPDSVVAVVNDEPWATQVDVKRRHPDGSVRHAVITVSAPELAAHERVEVELRSTAAEGDTAAPSLADLLAGGFDAVVGVTESGITYTASARALLEGTPPVRWLSGALVNELRVSGPLAAGTAPHPALAVSFDIRFQGPDGARVSTVLENAFHDTPGNLTYDVSISGVDPAFEARGVEHFHHARWRHVAAWGTAMPTVSVRHDTAYLIEVGVLPRYDLSRVVPQSSIDALLASWNESDHGILGNGIVTAYFPTTGGRGDIGPLPSWTTLALLSQSKEAIEVTHGVGDLAGSFSVHYRDRETGRAMSIDDHPTVTLNQSAGQYSDPGDKLPSCANCDSPYTVDAAHQPSLSFVPYLLTGDPYYLDELYFWASFNFIDQNWDYRGKEQGLLESQQVRAQAWTLRTLAHTAWIAPDGDPEGPMLEDKLANNLTWYANNAVGSNPFGWWGAQSNWGQDGGRPDENMAADVRYYTSPWQSDFLVWAFDYTAALGYTEAAPTRDWLAGFTVGRFTHDPEYNPYDGAPYHIAVSSDTGDNYATWAELWEKSFANRTDPSPTEMPTASCAYCYPAIARVALGAALHGSVTDAQQAYDFVNESLTPFDDAYDEDPTWAIVP